MPYSMLDDPTRWRERPEEARSIVEQLNEPESRRMLLRIAEDYERLAEHAECAQKRVECIVPTASLSFPAGPDLTYRLASPATTTAYRVTGCAIAATTAACS